MFHSAVIVFLLYLSYISHGDMLTLYNYIITGFRKGAPVYAYIKVYYCLWIHNLQ